MMFLKKVFWSVWRVWFFTLALFLIVSISPILLLSFVTEKGYHLYFIMSRLWAKGILFGMGFRYKVEQEEKLDKKKSYMFVANHTSMIDIMLMLATVKYPFVFVGKAELARIPFFGFFYKRTVILVDRKDRKSRLGVFSLADRKIKLGFGICIFPEGGVPGDESIILDTFKEGAFRLAIEHQLPIVPLTFPDNKRLFSYTFFSGSPGLMRVKIHKPIETVGKTLEDKKEICNATREVILKQLKEYGIK